MPDRIKRLVKYYTFHAVSLPVSDCIECYAVKYYVYLNQITIYDRVHKFIHTHLNERYIKLVQRLSIGLFKGRAVF